MNNTLSLSVILPIKSAKAKDFTEYFEKAITSLKNQQIVFEELVIVHTQEQSLVEILEITVLKTLKELGFLFLNLMTNILLFGLKM